MHEFRARRCSAACVPNLREIGLLERIRITPRYDQVWPRRIILGGRLRPTSCRGRGMLAELDTARDRIVRFSRSWRLALGDARSAACPPFVVLVLLRLAAGLAPRVPREGDELGALLAARGIGLVYGGASVGVMRAVADAAQAAGGEVIGVIPRGLVSKEVANLGLPISASWGRCTSERR